MQLSIIKEILILIIDKTYFEYSNSICSQKKQPTNSEDCWLNYYSLSCFEYLPINGSVIKLNFKLF